MPPQKELHFFTHQILSSNDQGPGDKEVDQFNVKSREAYLRQYKDVTNEKAIGDASPSYINYPQCIPQLKNVLGDDLKVVVILRDPVERAYSNYLHLRRENREPLGFYEALMEEPVRREARYADFWYYTFNSFYFEKIMAYRKAFENVLILTLEELKEDTEGTMRKLYEFIGVDPDFRPSNEGRQYNPGGAYKQNWITRFIFQQSKGRSFLKKAIPITPWMKHLKHRIIQRYKTPTPEMEVEARSYLQELLAEDVALLNRELKIRTELWKNF